MARRAYGLGWGVAWLVASGAVLYAQQPIGSVALQDATVTGDLSVNNGRAMLLGASSVTAKDRTAEIVLERGGTIDVCATSGVHLTQSHNAGAQPLLIALNRGAIEVHMAALSEDAVLTPDMRVSVHAGGPLDLRMRVTPNGDTCVENRGAGAPTLDISNPFGDASYELKPNQHVLFEHGDLRQVVDSESSPCGCPAAQKPGMSMAEALIAPNHPKSASQKAAEEHPFPAAVSQGLAPSPATPAAPAGTTHAQVSTTLGYRSDGSGDVSGTAVPPKPVPPEPLVTPAAVPSPQPQKGGFFHAIGHFFARLFGR